MSTLETEAAHLEALSTPQIENTEDIFDIISWDDVLIPKVTTYLSLKDLFTLRCCSRKTKNFVEEVFEQLKEINLAGNNDPKLRLAFTVLGKNCLNLRALQLARCKWLNEECFLPILTNNQRLQIVNLNDCVYLTPSAIQPIIIKCKELKVLKLSNCSWFSSGAVDALTLHQNNLEEFDMSNLCSIGERCLSIFFRKFHKLKILALANVEGVTDAVLIQISNYCRNLEHLNLKGCRFITDYGINAISTYCTRLQILFIAHCPRITENVLTPLRKRVYIDRPKRLEFNHHDFTPFYPSDFLVYHPCALVSNCRQLQSLMVKNCLGVTENALAPLRGRLYIDRPAQSINVPAFNNPFHLMLNSFRESMYLA